MNKHRFILQFITKNPDDGTYNWNLLFPFAGVIIGCMTVALTLSIMEGMEYSIFTKLEQISFPGKLENIFSIDSDDLEQLLYKHDVLYQKGIEDQIMIMNGGDFRFVSMHGIEKFQKFIDIAFNEDMLQIIKSDNIAGIYIGRSLAVKLDIELGDTVMIVHPKNINIFTGLPDRKQMFVSGIFEMKIIDYDQQHIFCQYDAVKNFIPNNNNIYYLETDLSSVQYKLIQEKYPEIKYKLWEEKHQTFISAMKLEKFTYAIIGFLIVLIAGFTLMSMMSLSVMQKVPQIGILRAVGMENSDIRYIFIFQSIITSIISSITGISLSLILIYFDEKFNLIHAIFPGSILFDFPLILKSHYVILIFIISLILMIISGLYPSIKAANLDPVKSIGFRR